MKLCALLASSWFFLTNFRPCSASCRQAFPIEHTLAMCTGGMVSYSLPPSVPQIDSCRKSCGVPLETCHSDPFLALYVFGSRAAQNA